ncbi:MAG: sulfatase [Planctomycetota bacterium]
MPAADPHPDHPNLLFVFADQLGALVTGCYGQPQVRTPNLDRLAEDAVRFENAYTVAPLCTPFRGALFTGRYPAQTGIFRNGQRLPDGEPTLADRFNAAGYRTAYVGKWHLAGGPVGTWVPPGTRGGFTDFVGWDCGHARHLGQQYFDGDCPDELPLEGHETDALTDIAIERLQRHAAGDAPFCLFVSYQAPHPYCDPPEEYLAIYRDTELAYRPTVDPDARFTGYRNLATGEQDLKTWTERYFGEITHLDAALGRLFGELDRLGLRENTVLVFTSDHGDMGGCHGRFEKSVAYEEATRIPVLVRGPGVTGGRVVAEPFSSIDFFPTLLGLCGLPPCPTAEGADWADHLAGRTDTAPRRDIIMQLASWACIRRGDEKLTLSLDGSETNALFRLSADPYETDNRVDDPAEEATVHALAEAYRHFLQKLRERDGTPAGAAG